jgi:heptosyltransferase-3
LKHQYTTEGFWKRGLQRFIDYFVDLYADLFIDKKVTKQFVEPKKILFVSLGHMGDALIGSYVFPLIRERFPNAELDVLTNEWCKPVLENNRYINKLILHNHLRGNRSNISFWEKLKRHYKSSRTVVNTVRSRNYDLAIEGRISHPNGNLICYRGRIKKRIGFGSGGFGSLLSEEVPLPEEPNFHFLQAVLEELRRVGIQKNIEDIKPYFFISKKINEKKHTFEAYFNDSYFIINPESGYPLRMMSEKFWFEIFNIILRSRKYKIFLCGTSNKSLDLFRSLITNVPDAKGNVINAVQKLSINEYFLLSANAKLSITVESLPAHLCSINCNTVSFYKDGAGSLFFPIPNKQVVLIHNDLSSRNSQVHPLIKSFYVKDVESSETYLLFETIIKDDL